jgi:limonene-1,2-epoxide hydrolase
MLDRETFSRWLQTYFSAWEEGDPRLLIETFAPDGAYNETPFAGHMRGREEIAAYWREGAGSSQEHVTTSYRILAIEGSRGYARWRAGFDRTGKNIHVELDGVMEVIFNADMQVRTFNEWWHRKEEQS